MTEILTKELYKLEDAFPNGMNQTEYRMVITLLYEDYSDRNLSDLLSTFTKKRKQMSIMIFLVSMNTVLKMKIYFQ